MRLQAGCEIVVEAEADCAVVAMLRPRSTASQWLVSETWRFTPQVRPAEFIDGFGNVCQRFIVPKGQMTLRAEIEIETEADIAVAGHAPATPPAQLPHDTVQFLLPSRYCPSDMLFDEVLGIVGDAAPGGAQVDAICQWIRDHIVYRYGESNASTDALETMRHGAGVCRDYAHVGIALCRALRLPARMVVGYLYQLEPMDLHAWFEVWLDGRWYTYDPTQAEPRGGRIVVATGRDAADVAFLTNHGGLATIDMQVWVGLSP